MSFYNNKNVLITGGAGITGHAMIRKMLNEGAYVRATEYKNRKIKIKHKNLEVFSCDLMKHEDCISSLKDIDICFNFVAFIRGAEGQTESHNRLDLVRKNLFPSINMFDAAIKTKIDRFGFIGSSTMYPDTSEIMKEDNAFSGEPHQVYVGVGHMKRYCEKVIEYYSKISKTKFARIRTSAIYGPHDAFSENGHAIPQLIMKADNRMNPFEVWGDGTQVRDFVYVEDIVDALALVTEKKADTTPYNVATGKGTTITELVNKITKIYGYEPVLKYDVTKPTMIHKRLLDVSKIEKELDWKSKYDLTTGLKNTIDWYVRNK